MFASQNWPSRTHTPADAADLCEAIGGVLLDTATFRGIPLEYRLKYSTVANTTLAKPTSLSCIYVTNAQTGHVARYRVPFSGILHLPLSPCDTIVSPLCVKNTCAHNDTIPLAIKWV